MIRWNKMRCTVLWGNVVRYWIEYNMMRINILNQMEYDVKWCNVMEWNGMELNGIELNWIELNWIEWNWIELRRRKLRQDNKNKRENSFNMEIKIKKSSSNIKISSDLTFAKFFCCFIRVYPIFTNTNLTK